MKNLIYPLLVVIAASCFGILSTIIKVAMSKGFTAAEAVTSQYFVGFALAAVLFFTTKRRIPRLRGWKVLALSGTFTAATGIVYGQSLEYLPASIAVVLLFQFTWIGMFMDCIVHRRWLKRTEAVSLILLFAGTLLAAGVIDADLSEIPWAGWAWGIAAAFSFSAFMFVNGIRVEGMDTTSRLFFVSLTSTVVIAFFQTPEIVWNGRLFVDGLWLYGMLLGLFGIVIPIYLFAVAVPHVGSGLASILSAMELPVAILASVLILNEVLSLLQLVGIVIILVGMILPNVTGRHAEASEPFERPAL